MNEVIITEKWCPKCRETKPRSAFWKDRAEASGLQSYCIVCTVASRKANVKLVAVPEKVCHACGQTKEASAFWKDKRISDGLKGKCAECMRTHTAKVFQISKAQRKPIQAKRCPTCKQTKPASDFWKDKSNLDGCSYQCKKCGGDKNRQRTTGASPEQVRVLLENQNGLCAICKRDPATVHRYGFSVDHCHTSGQVRAVLCVPCNSGLGMFGDSPERVYAAWQYLLKHRQLALVV